MIYLKNNTILQELYIPRQDYISNTTGSSGTYAEGYADGYESGYTSGSTDGFDSGYTEGYSSGETHQKGLLTSTGITENGEYQREDGWSAITVNVPQSGSILEEKEIVVSEDITVVTPDSGYDGFSAVTVDATEYGQENYDSGFDDGYTDGYSSGSSEGYDSGYTDGYQSGSTDGFNSGYTSGETHQKSLLASTAFTENGQYTRENGYSAITVNVPTGTSYNIEENKQFTANTNGSYSIKPSVYTTVNDSFENGVYMITFEHSGYPTNEIIEVLRVKDFSDPTKGDVSISIVRGQSSYYIGLWSGGTVYRESLTPLTLRFENANEHYGWVKDVGYIENYDLMSAVTLDVNVPMPKIEANKEFTATSNGNYTITPSSGTTTVTDRFDSDTDRYYITATASGYPLVGRYNLFYIEDEFDSSKGQIDVYIENGYLDYDDSDWYGGDIVDLSVSREIDLFIRNANRYFDWYPLEDFDYHYDAMSAVSLTVNVPQTGHTDQELQDAYDSGYTSGENNVISTFTATTATTNGVYGSSASPLSSITVNVPTVSGYTINQLASRQYGITDPTINVDVEPYAFCESKASASVLNGHLTIGSGCTSIGIAAFFNSFITSVTFTNENTIRFVGDSNFSLSRIQGELELPQNIELNTASTVNSNGAFGGCHYITSLIAKCSVITPKCFNDCNRLNTLELHNVSSIGGYAFDGCSALTNIKIYDKVPSIDNSRSPFLNVASSGTVHYESGLNVSTWQSNTDLSGWTFTGDL